LLSSFLRSTYLRHFHLQQLAEFCDLAGDVAHADGAVVRGAVDVPGLDKLARADRARGSVIAAELLPVGIPS
jgi:hypothetical protein